MPIRNARPITFRPKGLSDALDSSNGFDGAMQSLANLVVSPSTPNQFVPRPAAQSIYTFPGFNTPGAISAMDVIGTRVYGMIASQRFPGKDEPFVYDYVARQLIAVSGVTVANCPTTISPNGDWIPPVIVAVTNSRIIVTHPGFPGGAGPYFGWFDISSFVSSTLYGNTTAGSAVIASVQTPSGTSAPILSGVQPGQTISGPGIPAGATVLSAVNGTFSEETTGTFTAGSAVVTAIPSTAGFMPGMAVAGPYAATNAVIQSVDSATQITLTLAAIASQVAGALDVSGGGTITLSTPATATASAVALTVRGGTAASPLWGAGNTNTNPLSAVPTCVGAFNSRAYYGVGPYAVFSDPLNPTQITNASQALLLGDNTSITALVGLPLTSTVTGGTTQALIAFKGAESLFQITGDADASGGSTLAQNAITGSVGTLAPNTIVETPIGVAFIAPDGMRMLGLTGTVSDPIGANGKGVSLPFLNALNPTRMCAAFGLNVLRVSVQNGLAQGQPRQEYWFDFNEKVWTGPHTLPYSLIAFGAASSTFIGAPQAVPASLWQSTVIPVNSSIYTENGASMTWDFISTLAPDNAQGEMNQVVQTTIAFALATTDTVRVVFYDENFIPLDTVYVTGITPPPTLWGQFKWGRARWSSGTGSVMGAPWDGAPWGGFVWGAAKGAFGQYGVPWTGPLVFKQMFMRITGTSAPGQAIGNIYVKYQVCGYQLQPMDLQEI
jgi:hypothetical protein